MKRMLMALATGVFAAFFVAGCVVGDGALGGDPPLPCRLYPDDPQKCWRMWRGHIVQSCGEGDSRPTRLYFDRQGVSDSLRVNVISMGDVPIIPPSPRTLLIDTGTVCDGGMCRNLIAELTVYNFFPGHHVTGTLYFWEPEMYGDSLMNSPADGGNLVVDSVWRESCP